MMLEREGNPLSCYMSLRGLLGWPYSRVMANTNLDNCTTHYAHAMEYDVTAVHKEHHSNSLSGNQVRMDRLARSQNTSPMGAVPLYILEIGMTSVYFKCTRSYNLDMTSKYMVNHLC